MMEGVSSNHDDKEGSSVNGNPVEGNTRQDQVKQPAAAAAPSLLAATDDNDASTHASLAAMSTDDVSSMGDTYYTGTNSAASRRNHNSSNKRKDDCSESRCTVTSEESVRSRRRRCRSQQRWLDRIDRKAATSHAPIRPNRSDDDSFLLPLPPTPVGVGGDCSGGGSAAAAALTTRSKVEAGLGPTAESTFGFQRSVSHSLPRTGTEHFFHSFSNLTTSQAAATTATRRRGNSCSERPATKGGRDIPRCQSMSLPPVRPTRTRDDSKSDLMRDDSTNPELMKEDSNTDLMKDDSKAAVTCSDTSNRSNETADKDEIDPDMYVRLLRGQSPLPPVAASTSLSLSPPILASSRSGGCQAITTKATDPPKKPRRRSYADRKGLDGENCKQTSSPTRLMTLASSRDSNNCPHHSRCQSLRGDNCSHFAVSPKPPAKPSRTIDDAILEGAAEIPEAPNNSTDLTPPLLPMAPMAPRVSEDAATLLEDKKMTSSSDHASSNERRQITKERLEMSSSNRMDLEQADDEEELEEEEETETLLVEDVVEEEEETEVSIPASVKEYDPDLFARLLNGESCSKDAVVGSPGLCGDANNAEEAKARVSSNNRVRGVAPTLSGYNRFDNSASCAMPEHMEGAMKSSHPPMRPRRSFDEGMMAVRKDAAAVSLASAAAVACVAGATTTTTTTTSNNTNNNNNNNNNTSSTTTITAAEECAAPASAKNKRRICIIGGKRRYYRPSRRATLALASELPPSSENENTVVAANTITTGGSGATVSFQDEESPNDFSPQEASFAIGQPPLYHHESSYGGGDVGGFTEIDERDEYVQRVDPIAVPDHHHQHHSSDGSYQRILPARRHRRVVRRFTMPSKGGEEMTSPQTKKRRTIGRSLSCRPSSTQNGATPAA